MYTMGRMGESHQQAFSSYPGPPQLPTRQGSSGYQNIPPKRASTTSYENIPEKGSPTTTGKGPEDLQPHGAI